MLILSQEDRSRLMRSLEAELPSVKPPLSNVFSLMLALLHDQQVILDMAQGQMRSATDLKERLQQFFSRYPLPTHSMDDRPLQ